MAENATPSGVSDPQPARAASRTRTSGLWMGLILSAVVLVFLLIFVLQNRDPAQIAFLAWEGALPTGVALLFAAVAGVLLVAIPGSIRILQLRRAARRVGGVRSSSRGEPGEVRKLQGGDH